ncbi:SAM-dependent methyltransferase, partial [Streptomyces sp. NPDC056831]|uniref:SAM-dependent methyltransferase n=1 Tax=Streptomyces sp. NPDC056831 TaxID=3345954 RepID=UPI0036AD702A
RRRCSPIPRCGKTLDLSRPIAVVMNAVLHFIPDDQRPDRIVRAYLNQAAPGSYLALTHAAPDPTHPDEQNAMLADYQKPPACRSPTAPPSRSRPGSTASRSSLPGWCRDRAGADAADVWRAGSEADRRLTD